MLKSATRFFIIHYYNKMEIQHQNSGTKGKVFIASDDRQLAMMEYHRGAENKIIIDHTEVDPSLKGQGVGKKLVDKMVEIAREEQVKIIPVCPFAKATMEKYRSDYEDVL